MKKTFFTAGDITPHTCTVCGKKLEIADIDTAEGLAWLSCPDYVAGDDRHDSYSERAVLEVVTETGAGYIASYISGASEADVLAAAKAAGAKVEETRYGYGLMLHPDSFYESVGEWKEVIRR